MGTRIDLTGKRFGKLVALKIAGRDKDKKLLWLCQCDCGGTKIVPRHDLRRLYVRSCGCLPGGVTRHGKCKTRVYQAWLSLRARCRHPGATSWSNYGGRGITVCERWSTFENFHADMGDPPPGMSIERIDNNKGYEPGNCKGNDILGSS
jgi:hypothetical protein